MVKHSYRATDCATALVTEERIRMLARLSHPYLAAWWPVEQEFVFVQKCKKLGFVPHFKIKTFQQWEIDNFPNPIIELVFGYAGVERIDYDKLLSYLGLLRNYILGINGSKQSVFTKGNKFIIGDRANFDNKLKKLKIYIETMN